MIKETSIFPSEVVVLCYAVSDKTLISGRPKEARRSLLLTGLSVSDFRFAKALILLLMDDVIQKFWERLILLARFGKCQGSIVEFRWSIGIAGRDTKSQNERGIASSDSKCN